MTGNTFNNSGNFTGAAVFQGSTIHNAGQIAGTMVHGDTTSKEELQKLLQQLGEALKQVPSEKVEAAEAVGASAEDLVKEAAKEQPNKTRLRTLGETLVNMAKAVGDVAPKAIGIATGIVALIAKIQGLG